MILRDLKEMPCACKVPADKYPENAEWGPIFWRILHGLAERAGTLTNVLLQGDERRTWIMLLTKIQDTLPCDVCRDHFGRWLAQYPVSGLLTIPYDAFGRWIRLWLFALHNEVNEGNDKPVFSEADLRAVYKDVSITATWRALEPVMKKAIGLNGVPLLAWKRWVNTVRQLQGLYGNL
jgi:hypothetical protein